MSTEERNNWDRANEQRKNHAEFNKESDEKEIRRTIDQNPDKAPKNDLTVNNLLDPEGSYSEEEEGQSDDNHTQAHDSDSEKLDFLSYGTSDDDIQF